VKVIPASLQDAVPSAAAAGVDAGEAEPSHAGRKLDVVRTGHPIAIELRKVLLEFGRREALAARASQTAKRQQGKVSDLGRLAERSTAFGGKTVLLGSAAGQVVVAAVAMERCRGEQARLFQVAQQLSLAPSV
jgi:hypothetical protein